MDNIKVTLDLVEGASQSLSTSNIVAIVVAIISLIGVIINVMFTNSISKKINQNNGELQEKLNQKNIDANLKAKARIEWIQNVRKTSAELISIYYQLLNSTDKKILLETFISSQEKVELLILFFGSEKKHKGMVDSVSINDMGSNEGKNDLIVDFLSNLSKDFYIYYDKVLKDEKSNLEKIRSNRWNIMYDNIIDSVVHIYVDDDGIEHYNEEPIFDPESQKKVYEVEEKIEEHIRFVSSLQERLVQLRDIIRLYLKIEWDKAKSGD